MSAQHMSVGAKRELSQGSVDDLAEIGWRQCNQIALG
jgi:hypothetical protein